MCNTIACLFFLLASTLIRPKASTWSRNKDYGLRRCKSDSHCNNNQFCFFNGDEGYCNPCIDCTERYKRKTPEDGCAKSRSLCGPCITGYMDIDGECVQVILNPTLSDQNPAKNCPVWFKRLKKHILYLRYNCMKTD